MPDGYLWSIVSYFRWDDSQARARARARTRVVISYNSVRINTESFINAARGKRRTARLIRARARTMHLETVNVVVHCFVLFLNNTI